MPPARSVSWRKKVEGLLPLLGHRNWIAVVDSAYPWQTAAGVETVVTGAGQLEVARFVLDAVERSGHVRAVLYLDAELESLDEGEAPGISAYREGLRRQLARRQVETLSHDKIIAALDEAGKAFRVLVLKTRMRLPYTSVFIRLDCGYWDEAAEKKLRRSLARG